MRICHRRSLWPLTAGGACILAGVFLFVLLLTVTGCAVGFSDPGPDGKSEVVFGAGLGAVAKVGNDLWNTTRDFVTSPDGLAAIASGGGILGLVGYLGRRVARNGAAAAAQTAAREAEARAWDEATAAANNARDRADAAFDEASIRTLGGVGPAPARRPGPVAGEVGA
jgi:hypothetical protein